jgi:hypothetical protein
MPDLKGQHKITEKLDDLEAKIANLADLWTKYVHAQHDPTAPMSCSGVQKAPASAPAETPEKRGRITGRLDDLGKRIAELTQALTVKPPTIAPVSPPPPTTLISPPLPPSPPAAATASSPLPPASVVAASPPLPAAAPAHLHSNDVAKLTILLEQIRDKL